MEVIRILKAGGVIAYPTETVYGFGCDPRNAKAVAKIFRIKEREKGKPVLMVASSVAQVRKVAVLTGASLKLAKQFWPGALTLVLPVRSDVTLAKGVSLKGEVAVRVSSSEIVQKLTRRFGFPIVSTSANLSGEEPCRSAEEVVRVFGERKYQPDFIVDGGKLPKRASSTIVRVTEDGRVEVLRQGSVRV